MVTINNLGGINISIQNILLFIFVIIITLIVGAILNILIIRLLKTKTKPAIHKPISKIGMYSIYVLGLYFGFTKVIGLDIGSGLAALGILGITLILPTIPFIQNIVAGVIISIERPFNEGDIIEVNNMLCKVKDIMFRKTVLRALDGKIIMVPNNMFIASSPIINYTKGEFIRITLNIDITFDSNKEKAKEIIKSICAENKNILPNIPEKKITKLTKLFIIPQNFFKIKKNIKDLSPKVMIKNVSKDKVSLEVWLWIWNIINKEAITSSFYERLMEEFSKENIKFG